MRNITFRDCSQTVPPESDTGWCCGDLPDLYLSVVTTGSKWLVYMYIYRSVGATVMKRGHGDEGGVAVMKEGSP